MGFLDKISWNKTANILALFAVCTLLLAAFFGVWVWVEKSKTRPAPVGITATEYNTINAANRRLSDSSFQARETSARRQTDSLFGVIFPIDSLLKLFSQNQQTRDAKYSNTAAANDSTLYRQWGARYGAN